MEFRELLQYGRILKNENEDIRENLERLQNFTSEQLDIFDLVIENKAVCNVIDGIENKEYAIYDNFYDYIDEYMSSLFGDLPSFIELDYISMYYRTFRYDDNLFIDWQELGYCKDRNEYGTSEQKENQRAFIEYNLQYSKCIDFYG